MALADPSAFCANLPLTALAVLAGLRSSLEVRVKVEGDRTWVYWRPGDDEVGRCVAPVFGVELYERREGGWYRQGRRLPYRDVPEDDATEVLHRALIAAPLAEEPAPTPSFRPAVVRLVRDGRPRPTMAMRCPLSALAQWADLVPSAQLRALRVAWTGDLALLLGTGVPLLAGGERFWGTRVLVPLGRRVEPALPESALCEALGLSEDEILCLESTGTEVLPLRVFEPLTRAGVRLAGQGARLP
jgi:hypothetical protein